MSRILFSLVLFLIFSCARSVSPAPDAELEKLASESRISWHAVRFAVMSDLHYYDPTLGTNGSAFESYLANDRKLLRQSPEIVREAVSRVIREKPAFVLVPGDLTKDGETVCHAGARNELFRLVRAGIPVYVINGNHDLNNGEAVRYSGDSTESVPVLSGADFSNFYKNLGYGNTLDRDPHSLSYLAEPVPGLWLLAVDSCRWRENKPHGMHIVGGRVGTNSLRWIRGVLVKALKQNKAVIALMHHGVLEHYRNNIKNYPDYVLENHPELVALLRSGGVRAVFTGHFHAQDVTVSRSKDGTPLYDIETGSLSTYPLPYRVVTITSDRKMNIRSGTVDSIPSIPEGLPEFAKQYVLQGTEGMATTALLKYGLSSNDCRLLAPQVATAYVAHLEGDERPPAKIVDTTGVGLWGQIIIQFRKNLLDGWWHDLEPADNEVPIDLE